jgi:hypothetical protein
VNGSLRPPAALHGALENKGGDLWSDSGMWWLRDKELPPKHYMLEVIVQNSKQRRRDPTQLHTPISINPASPAYGVPVALAFHALPQSRVTGMQAYQ